MNREIKLRAWNVNEKKMDSWLRISEKGFISNMCHPGELIWSQYTGLKDKNGKEIYEGDVVIHPNTYYGKDRPMNCEVQWRSGAFWFFRKDLKINTLMLHDFDRTEVIGNIYENPELIA